MQKVALLFSILITISFIPAFAQVPDKEPSPFWGIRKWFDDVWENTFVPPGVERALVKIQNAAKYQNDFENGETSTKVEMAVKEKIASAEAYLNSFKKSEEGVLMKIGGGIVSVQEKIKVEEIEKAVQALKQAGELNEIRKLHLQFKDVLARNDPLEIANYNAKVNALSAWQLNCNGSFDVREFRNDIDSFEKLKDYCPPLKNASIEKVKEVMSGGYGY